MAIDLKNLHPILYQRARLVAITNFLLGFTLIINEHLPKNITTQVANSSRLNGYLSYDIWGLLFVIAGAGVLVGLYRTQKTYRITRIFVSLAFIYALFWESALFYSLFKTPQSASILVLWGYYTYDQLLLAKDTGWKGAEIVKSIRGTRHEQ